MRYGLRRQMLPLFAIAILSCAGSDEGSQVLLRVGEQGITLGEFQRSYHEMLALEPEVRADSSAARRYLKDYMSKTLLEQIAADSVEWTPLFEHRVQSYLEVLMVRAMNHDAYAYQGHLTDDELRKIYERARTVYHYRALPCPSREDAMQKLLNVREGARFNMMADRILGRGDGGDMGWQTILEAPESIIDVLDELGPEEVGGPVETGGQFFLLQLVEKAENPTLRPFDEVSQMLRFNIYKDRGGTLKRHFMAELLRKYRYEMRMAEIIWMTEFLREETGGLERTFDPDTLESGPGGTVTAPKEGGGVPWTESPFTEEEKGRILATTSVDTISAALFLDHMLTKLFFTWPSFERPEHVTGPLRELVIQRLSPHEARARGYDQDPDLQWKIKKRRGLVHTRQLILQKIRPQVLPTTEDVFAYYQEFGPKTDDPEMRRYIMVIVTNDELAERAREILLREPNPEQAYQEIKALDPDASWLGARGFTVVEDQASGVIDQRVFQLRPGQVTESTPVGDRVAVARLETIHRPMRQSFEEVFEDLRRALTQGRIDSLMNVYLDERRSITPVVVDEAVFRQIRFERPPAES